MEAVEQVPLCRVEIHDHLGAEVVVVAYTTPQPGEEAVDDFGPAAIASQYFLHHDPDADPLLVSIQWCATRVVIHFHAEPGREQEARAVLFELQNGPFEKGKGGVL